MIALLAGTGLGQTWYRIQVTQDSATNTEVILDREKNPHIFYYIKYAINQPTDLAHSWWNGSSWEREIVAPAASWHNDHPSVVLDDQGRFHLSYYDRQHHLGYAWQDSVWHFEVVDARSDLTGDESSLKLDAQGRPHVAYLNGSALPLWLQYAYKDRDSWVYHQFPEGIGSFSPTMVLDSGGRPHIMSINQLTYDLHYTWFDGDSWHNEILLYESVSAYVSLLFDKDWKLNAAIYYAYGGGHFSLGFIEQQGEAWQTCIVDPGRIQTKRGWECDLCMTPDREMHIAHHCHNEELLRYAHGDSSQWEAVTVDNVGEYNGSVSIDTDSSHIYIAYCNQALGSKVWLATTRDLTGVREERTKAEGQRTSQTICRGVLCLPKAGMTNDQVPMTMSDAAGRKVMDLHPGRNDVSRVAPGVYFLRSADGGRRSAVRKVVIQR
jgi:hypothetical protein